MKLRKSSNKLNLRKRYNAVTSKEKVIADKYKRCIFRALATAEILKLDDREDVNDLLELADLFVLRYLTLILDFEPPLPRPLRLNRTVDSFTKSQCWNYFEFRKSDLNELIELLQFDGDVLVTLDNGSRMPGEEVFLRGLYEMVSADDQNTIAETVFGRDFSQQGRATTWFVNHLYENFAHLVHDNLAWFHESGLVEQSADAIEAKLRSLGFEYEEGENRYGFLLDCNCQRTSRAGGGPAEAGANAARYHDNVQRSVYNGWKSIHGVKHQTLDTAHGLTADMYGPMSVRRNDLRLLGDSEIELELEGLQLDWDRKVIIFGDSIYPIGEFLKSYLTNPGNNDRISTHNGAMKSVRISIEWNYATTAALFEYVKDVKKLRLLRKRTTVKIYTVCTILRNCHVCLYGSQSSIYFNIVPPSLSDYILQI
jgi:hypothetical protein